MSYILEALKKADRKRKIGAIPDLHTDHNLIREELPQRTLWPYFLALLLFFNAGVILWWLEPWGKEAVQKESRLADSVQEEVEQLTDEKIAAALSVGPKPELPVGNVLEDVVALAEQEKKPAEHASSAENNVLPEEELLGDGDAQIDPSEDEQAVMVIPEDILEGGKGEFDEPFANISAIDELEGSEKSDNAAEQEIKVENFDISKVPFAYQLPASIKQKLPEITISFHSYTFRPATRMVRVNGRIMREGHNLTKEIKLEKIVPTGVVLLFGQRRFRVDV